MFFLSTSILRGTSTPSCSPCPWFEPAPRTNRSLTLARKKKKKILYASRISLALAKSDREDTSYKGFGTMDPSVVAAVPEGLRKVVEENTAKTSLGDAEHTSSKQPTIKPSTTQTQNVHERRQKDKGRKPRRRALGAILFRSLKNPCNHL